MCFTGWQPGIQEGAAQWDEDWDKLEDEGETDFFCLSALIQLFLKMSSQCRCEITGFDILMNLCCLLQMAFSL